MIAATRKRRSLLRLCRIRTEFAQVEGVAVLARLLNEHMHDMVDLVKQTDDEVVEMAQERALRCAEDCEMHLLLRMRDVERVKIKLTRQTYTVGYITGKG
jgi:hypothetical protein